MSSIENESGNLSGSYNGTHNTEVCEGSLFALTTKAELDAHFRLLEAYVVAIPAKRANAILRYLLGDGWH